MKNTIRIISIIAFIAIMGITLTNCEEPNFPAELCYVWYSSPEAASVELLPMLEFKSNGDYVVAGAAGRTGTYTVSGDTITFKLGGLVNTGTSKYKISGKALTISGSTNPLTLVLDNTYYRK